MARYVAPKPLSRDQAETGLASTDVAEVCQTLIDIAFFEADAHWALDRALAFTKHDDAQIASAATTAIGHLARLHRSLDMTSATARLRELRLSDATALAAKYALEDIETFRRSRD